MKLRHVHAGTKQRITQAIYITATVVVTGMMFYLNYRHERNLNETRRRVALLQEQINNDPRVNKVALHIDREAEVSIVSGTVSSPADLKALTDKLFSTPPLPGTHQWKTDVEVAR